MELINSFKKKFEKINNFVDKNMINEASFHLYKVKTKLQKEKNTLEELTLYDNMNEEFKLKQIVIQKCFEAQLLDIIFMKKDDQLKKISFTLSQTISKSFISDFSSSSKESINNIIKKFSSTLFLDKLSLTLSSGYYKKLCNIIDKIRESKNSEESLKLV